MQLTSREVANCFRIRYGNQSGTCFLYSSNDGTYFVSAKHVLRGCHPGDHVHLALSKGDWAPLCVAEIVNAADDIDVCIFACKNFGIRGPLNLHDGEGKITLGQNIKFLGFPHGLTNTYPSDTGFSAPLVRNAFFSGEIIHKGAKLMILDGFNNPGYSGGPMYSEDKEGNLHIAGVISGYRYEAASHSAVVKRGADGEEDILPDIHVRQNSGMIYAHPIFEVLHCQSRLGVRNLVLGQDDDKE